METADDSLVKQDEAARQELDKAAQQALDAIARRYDEATSALARQRSQDHSASASATPAPREQPSSGAEDLVEQVGRRGHHRRS